MIFQFPLVKSCPACAVLLEGGRENAIHAVRQIGNIPAAHLGSEVPGRPVPFQRVVFRGPAKSNLSVVKSKESGECAMESKRKGVGLNGPRVLNCLK
jgi:hypothetical protein